MRPDIGSEDFPPCLRVSEFDQRVYRQLRRVPRGSVVSYAALARSIACGSARAIGQALKRNPHAPTIPCHRVVRSDGSIGGYQGSDKSEDPRLRRKIELLASEGVYFDTEGKLLDPSRLLEAIDPGQ